MRKYSNSKVIGEVNLWQADFNVSASDDGSMSGSATYISANADCPLEFGDTFPFAGFPSLKLTEYTSKSYGAGLYQISCTFKASSVDSKETDSENNDEDEDGDDNNNNDEDVSEEEVDGGEVVDDNETEEKVNDTWTVTGGLETRPLNEHGNYKEFDAKGLEEKFAILADGKVDIQAFFEHGVIVPINPNDVSFNPNAYSGASTTLNAASSDFLNRLLKGNTIYFAPTYNATINSIGEPKSTAHGLNGLIAGMNMEVVSTNTVTENGVKRSSTTLQQKKEQ